MGELIAGSTAVGVKVSLNKTEEWVGVAKFVKKSGGTGRRGRGGQPGGERGGGKEAPNRFISRYKGPEWRER